MKNNALFMELFQDKAEEVFLSTVGEWTREYRHYHTYSNHLLPLLEKIRDFYRGPHLELLELVALFHDVIYDPKRKDNEIKSVEFFNKRLVNEQHPSVQIISDIIMDTTHYTEQDYHASSALGEVFMQCDTWALHRGDLKDLMAVEDLLLKEFQFVNYPAYIVERINFLQTFHSIHRKKHGYLDNRVLPEFISYLKTKRPYIGVYAGSFNPFHNGHRNILQKSEQLFDKVIVAVAKNPDKSDFKSLIGTQNKLPYHEVVSVEGFLTDYLCDLSEYAEVVLIRGLRNGKDFDYELNQYRFLQDMYPSIKTVWIPCDREYDYISSSALRGLEAIETGSGAIYGY